MSCKDFDDLKRLSWLEDLFDDSDDLDSLLERFKEPTMICKTIWNMFCCQLDDLKVFKCQKIIIERWFEMS